MPGTFVPGWCIAIVSNCFMSLGVLGRGHAAVVVELPGKMLGTGETHMSGDFAHTQFTLTKQKLAFLQTNLGDIFSRRDAEVGLEQLADIRDADVDRRGQFFQTGRILTALGDDLQYLIYDAVFSPERRRERTAAGIGSSIGAKKFNENNLQKRC